MSKSALSLTLSLFQTLKSRIPLSPLAKSWISLSIAKTPFFFSLTTYNQT